MNHRRRSFWRAPRVGTGQIRRWPVQIPESTTGVEPQVIEYLKMFDLPVWQISEKLRTGPGQWFAEFVATFGLLLTIFGCAARAPSAVPYAVGLYITAAY